MGSGATVNSKYMLFLTSKSNLSINVRCDSEVRKDMYFGLHSFPTSNNYWIKVLSSTFKVLKDCYSFFHFLLLHNISSSGSYYTESPEWKQVFHTSIINYDIETKKVHFVRDCEYGVILILQFAIWFYSKFMGFFRLDLKPCTQ